MTAVSSDIIADGGMMDQFALSGGLACGKCVAVIL